MDVIINVSPVKHCPVSAARVASNWSSHNFFPLPPPLSQVLDWLYNISFVLAFGGLLMKTWRIYRIFCNAELRKRVSCMQREHSTPSLCTVSVCQSVSLSVCLSVCLSVYLSVCLSVCVSNGPMAFRNTWVTSTSCWV